MKYCYACKRTLSYKCFNKNKSKSDGYHDSCKTCKKESDKKYNEKYKDKLKVTKHLYYEKNKQSFIDRANKNIVKNRERVRGYGRTSRFKIKSTVFSHYCDENIKCKICNENDIDILSIDHIGGKGNDHRKEIGISGGHRFYFWLKSNNYPDGYQILCMNCQYRKRMGEMKPDNPTKKQLKQAAYVQKLKLECLSHYGNICPCGEKDLVILTLDHVNDDGENHRKEKKKRGFAFYLDLKKNKFPNDPPLQVLCMNCQFRKRAKNEKKIAERNREIARAKDEQNRKPLDFAQLNDWSNSDIKYCINVLNMRERFSPSNFMN